MLFRPPCSALRPYLSLVWADDGAPDDTRHIESEWVLPSGAMHLVIRIEAEPGRGWSEAEPFSIPTAVVGGMRDAPYRKAVSRSGSVGVILRPGAAMLLLRAPAGALARQHTCLGDIWTPATCDALEDRLAAARTPALRLGILEDELTRRLSDPPPVDPIPAYAARGLACGVRVAELVRDVGCSHRHFAARFFEAVGIGPKPYQRLARFNRALDHIHSDPTTPLAQVAAGEGYADQAHFTREFRAFTGLTPDGFRRLAPRHAHHVPVLA